MGALPSSQSKMGSCAAAANVISLRVANFLWHNQCGTRWAQGSNMLLSTATVFPRTAY